MMDVLLIALLTLLNGAFAMSELALAASRKARLAPLAEAGDVGAQTALRLMEQPTQFLSTVQVGITSIGVLNGIIGEAAFSAGLAQWLVGLGIGTRPAGIAATAIVVALITFITIIFGELEMAWDAGVPITRDLAEDVFYRLAEMDFEDIMMCVEDQSMLVENVRELIRAEPIRFAPDY